MRILVVQLRQLGDILLTTPCTREIRRHYGKAAHISFLCHKMGKLILEGNPDIDEYYYYDPDQGLRAEYKLAQVLRRKRFDLVFDFMNNPRSALYTFATRAPQRFAFLSARRPAYTKTVLKPNTTEYIVKEKFKLLHAAGINATDIQLVLPWQEHHAAVALKYTHLDPLMAKAKLRVILSPTHRRIDRQWPLIRFAELSDRLTREWGAAVTWLWGPGEEDLVKSGLYLTSQPASLAPKTTFREMAALIAHHDFFIGNSNGPSHVAVAVGTPSLQLHGPTRAASWCPCNDMHRAVQAGEPQSPSAISYLNTNEVWTAASAMHAVVQSTAATRKRVGLG